MRLSVVGLGLIGGSIAKDLRDAGYVNHVTGIDLNSDHCSKAIELGLVDEVSDLSKGVRDADVVLVSIPVNASVKVIADVLDHTSEKTLVVDTGSTKSLICKSLKDHPSRRRFVAAHPIAGTENSGPTAALGGLFRGKTNIICDGEKSDQNRIDQALALFEVLGLRTMFMQAEEHDRHVAYVSHLSHVSSFLLGKTVLDIEKDEQNIFALAGSGFASTVRLAKSSPEMWAPIFEQNTEHLSQALLEYIMHLQRFHYFLLKKDTAELTKIMTAANRIRTILDGIEPAQKSITTPTKNQ